MTAVAFPTALPAQPAFRPSRPAGPWFTLLTAVLTLGILPLWRWSSKWQRFVAVDRPVQIERAAAVHAAATEPQRRAISRAVARLEKFPLLAAGPSIAVGGVAILLVGMLASGLPPRELWELAFNPRHLRYWPIARTALEFHSTWLTLLCAGYGCQWLVVRRYVFARQSLLAAMGQPRSSANSIGGPGVGWALSAVPLCAVGAWWAIPMVLAGSIQRRHSNLIAPPLPPVFRETQFCRTRGCGVRLVADARFCSRCGAPVSGMT